MNLKVLACHTRAHCATCRTDADWRERVTGARDFDCPHGVTADKLPDGPKLPDPPPESDVRLAIARAKICEPCEHNKGVKLTIVSGRGTEHIYRVKCALCSTCGGGVSLVKAARVCKAGKWDNIRPSDPNHR